MKKRNTPKEMGQKIQLARKEAGYTQDELAELLDINPKNLSAVERGALGLSIERLCTISMALHVSVDSLLFSQENFDAGHCARIAAKLEDLSEDQLNAVEQVITSIIKAYQLGRKKE